MVAYSFKPMFAERIQSGAKCQTIRAHRKRHAREGERMQLFTGMRTKHCERIIPDPLCLGVQPIRIDLRGLEGCFKGPTSEAEARPLLARVTVDFACERLSAEQCETLAIYDGFGGYAWPGTRDEMSAFAAMVSFWIMEHGPILFEGVQIAWQHPHTELFRTVFGIIDGARS